MIDFSRIKTIPIEKRKSKVKVEDFLKLDAKIKFEDSKLKEVAKRIVAAYKDRKMIIFMIGAHVIKCGLSLYLIDLMKKGIVKHVAMNGAAAIHDFEIAYCGKTSEYVEETIKDGSFGMAEETGRLINEALKWNLGYGKAAGKMINDMDMKYKECSILYYGYKLNIPVTVHITIGAEVINLHPTCNGAALGIASYKDFRIFTDSVSKLEKGVLLNIGSAVVLPEVFIKALSLVRNLDYLVKNITTANFDMIKHYRPDVNIVARPTSLGGKGYHVIERHEKTIPALYNLIIENV